MVNLSLPVKKQLFSGLKAGVFVILTLLPQSVFASAADYVYTPAVVQGEREIDLKYGSAAPVTGNDAQAVSLGYGYGVTDRWFTEVYMKQERYGTQNSMLAELENKFQLTETGEYPVDVGLVTELEAPLSSRAPWEFRLGPLFQSDIGRLQMNCNLLFARSFGRADETGIPFVTNFSYQWQVKYRWQSTFEFGAQGLGELGKWNNWAKGTDQNHRFGPAVFGKFALGRGQAIKYNAAWLFGTGVAAPNHTLRLQVEYEY